MGCSRYPYIVFLFPPRSPIISAFICCNSCVVDNSTSTPSAVCPSAVTALRIAKFVAYTAEVIATRTTLRSSFWSRAKSTRLTGIGVSTVALTGVAARTCTARAIATTHTQDLGGITGIGTLETFVFGFTRIFISMLRFCNPCCWCPCSCRPIAWCPSAVTIASASLVIQARETVAG